MARSMTENLQVDGFDQKILKALIADGSLSNHQLAERVGLSESQCYRRRLRLEQSGQIQGYRAVVDPKTLGLSVSAFVHLSLVSQTTHQRRDFATYISMQSEILSCHVVTGDADYILRVRTANLAEFNEFVNRLLANGRSRLHVRSSVVLEALKEA